MASGRAYGLHGHQSIAAPDSASYVLNEDPDFLQVASPFDFHVAQPGGADDPLFNPHPINTYMGQQHPALQMNTLTDPRLDLSTGLALGSPDLSAFPFSPEINLLHVPSFVGTQNASSQVYQPSFDMEAGGSTNSQDFPLNADLLSPNGTAASYYYAHTNNNMPTLQQQITTSLADRFGLLVDAETHSFVGLQPNDNMMGPAPRDQVDPNFNWNINSTSGGFKCWEPNLDAWSQLKDATGAYLNVDYTPETNSTWINPLFSSENFENGIYKYAEQELAQVKRSSSRQLPIYRPQNMTARSGNHAGLLNTFSNPLSLLMDRVHDYEHPLTLEESGTSEQSGLRQGSHVGQDAAHGAPKPTTLSSYSSASSIASLLSKVAPSQKPKPNATKRNKKHYNIIRCGVSGTAQLLPMLKSVEYCAPELDVDSASIAEIDRAPWSEREKAEGRRIVQMRRWQRGTTVYVDFSIKKPDQKDLEPESEDVDIVDVSVIRSETNKKNQRPRYFITSVDFMEIVECVIGNRTLDNSDRRRERGRIRLNLMRFWLKTPLPSKKSIATGEHDAEVVELALKIRKYTANKSNKLPGFNKEVRIMSWENLVPAMHRALAYYVAEVPIGDDLNTIQI